MLKTAHLVNPLNAELNPICHLLALLGVYHFLHVSRIRVKSLTLRLLMSYIYIYIYDISSLRVKMDKQQLCAQLCFRNKMKIGHKTI